MSERVSGLATGIVAKLPEQEAALVSSTLASSKGLLTEFLEWFGELAIFSWRVARAAVTPPYELRELFRQLDDIGSKSLPLVALAGAAIGVKDGTGSAGAAGSGCPAGAGGAAVTAVTAVARPERGATGSGSAAVAGEAPRHDRIIDVRVIEKEKGP